MPINVLFLGRKMVASGGVENYMYNLFSSMDKEEFKIDFLIPYKKREGQAYLDQIEEQGGGIYLVPNQKENLLQHIISVYTVSKKYKKGIVHIHASDGFHAIDGIIARIAGVKRVIYHSHNASFKKSLGKKISRFLFGISGTYFLGCSKDAGEYLFGNRIANSNKFSVANNGIDTNLFKFSPNKRKIIREEFNIPKDTFLLGFVGRLSSEKNVEFAIKVFNELLTHQSEAMFMLVGDGDEKNKLEKMAEQLGIEKRIIFANVRQDIDYIMSSLDVLLLPSKYEALGIVLIEAQASGLQSIASKNVSNEAKITEQVHYLDFNITDWVKKTLSIGALKNRHQGFKDVDQAGYSLKSSAVEMEKLYKSLF